MHGPYANMADTTDNTSEKIEDALVTMEQKKTYQPKTEPMTTGRPTELIEGGQESQHAQPERVQPMQSEETLADGAIPVETAPAAPKRSRQPSKRGRLQRLRNYMILSIIVVAAAFGLSPWWYPRLPTILQEWIPDQLKPPMLGAPQSGLRDFSALEQRLSQAEASIAALRQELETTASSGGSEPRLARTIDNLAQRISALEERPIAPPGARESGVGMGEDVVDLSSLSARLTEIEATAESMVMEQAGAVVFLLSVAELRDALKAGQPYALQLDTVAALAKRLDMADIDTEFLLSRANNGVPSRAILQRRFGQIAPALVRAALLPSDSASWIQRTLDRILSVINVRQLDDDGSESVSAIVYRIENALADGDLSMAVSVAETLNGLPRQTAMPWLNDARAVDRSERTIAKITNIAIAQISKRRSSDDLSDIDQ